MNVHAREERERNSTPTTGASFTILTFLSLAFSVLSSLVAFLACL